MDYRPYFEVPEWEGQGEASLGASFVRVEESDDLEGCKLALISMRDQRLDDGAGSWNWSALLNQLAALTHHTPVKMAVFGNLKPGATLEDTEAAISEIMEDLLKLRVVPVVVTNHSELNYSIYKAFQQLEQIINITAVDSVLNIERDNEPGYIGRIIKEQPNFLFNYSNLGYQTYLVKPSEILMADELYFDAYRLGEVRGNVTISEPVIRSADFFTISANALKRSDILAARVPQPNGLYAEEVCQMMRYAGLGEKLRMVSLTDFHNSDDAPSTMLVAQMIWCLIDGVVSRKSEIPNSRSDSFLKYRVSLKDNEFQLVFYKSLKTDRWWMEVPVPPAYANKYRKHHLIPCGYDDYKLATLDDLPDRWWKAYKKML